ncbi:hypothetical protein J6590_040280 [Homalodisca vitripennis]|nr:hypothetical protein J6590_040280 [Homalodisca vitripennis]
MIKEIVIFTLLILGSTCFTTENKIQDVRHAIQTAISSAIQRAFYSFLRKPLSKISELKEQESIRNVRNEGASLNSTILVEVLENLKNHLPQQIPMIPFAVAEPTAKNVLVYFGILNSSFVNITQFDAEATVNNTNFGTDIAVGLHINTSNLEGYYELDVSNYDMHIFGNGDYSITSNGTDVFIKTSIEIFPNNSFLMSKFSLNMSIDSAQLVMTNFMGGDPSLQPLLDFIAQTIPAEAPIMMDLIQDSLNFTVTHFINSIVASVFSWDEIVSMIQSYA